MMISSELADALKLRSSSNSIPNLPSMEYDDDSICGSLPAACDDDSDLNRGGASNSGIDNSGGLLITLEDYEPPASLLMAVLEAERQMDEALSSFSSECSSLVAAGGATSAGASQVHCDDVENNNDDENAFAETAADPVNDNDNDRNAKESIWLESLSYSEAKRMAFSPLEAPNTADKGGNLNLESPLTEMSDLLLEAFLPNNSNCIVSSTLPSDPPQSTARISHANTISKRRMEALQKHKERTTRNNQQPMPSQKTLTTNSIRANKTPNFTRPESASSASTVMRKLSPTPTIKHSTKTTNVNQPVKPFQFLQRTAKKIASTNQISNPTTTTTKTKTTSTTSRTYNSTTLSQGISPTFKNTSQKQAHSQQYQKQIQSTKTPLSSTPTSTQILQSHTRLSRSKSSGASGAAGTITTTTATTPAAKTFSTPLGPTKAPITRPKSPNFMTTTRLGKPSQHKHPIPPGFLSKSDDPKHRNSSKINKLTIPRPPRLSTSERHGEKVYSTTAAAAMAATTVINPNGEKNTFNNRSAENSVTSINNTNNKTLLFMTDTKSALVVPPHFVNMLRDHGAANNYGCGGNANTMSPTSSNIKRKKDTLSVTVPITPQVMKRSTRYSRHSTASPNQNELSTQEKRELEDIAYIATHQFKARALPKTTTTAPSNTFTNHSRASLLQNNKTTTGRRTFTAAPPTETALSSADEIELTKKFRALPLPKFLAKTTTTARAHPSIISSSKQNHDPDFATRPKIITIPTPRKPQQPKVTTDTTRFSRGAHKPLHSSDGNIHNNVKVTPRPSSPKPFNLLSERRGVLHQEQLQERIRLEEQQRDTLARSFKAMPMPKFSSNRPTPSRKQSTTPLTEPCEFRLQTDLRHELHHAELESKIEAMETRRIIESVIKPLPIPKTLYSSTFKPVVPSELGREPIQGSAPHLETIVQSIRRQSFDQEAKKRREKEERIKKLMEQEEELETDREIRELRQLPANEGGFNPVTNVTSHLKLGSSHLTQYVIPARLSLHQ